MREIDQKLFDAVWHGDLDAVKAALDQGADPNAKTMWGETPLHYAVGHDRAEMVKLLLDAGADTKARDFSGDTPLRFAEALHRAEIAASLRAAGAKVIKMHGSIYAEAGTPDLIGCYHGRCFVIEVKIGRKNPTPIQALRFEEWETAGAARAVAREDFDVGSFLCQLDEEKERG